jgi:hypothetical protein
LRLGLLLIVVGSIGLLRCPYRFPLPSKFAPTRCGNSQALGKG